MGWPRGNTSSIEQREERASPVAEEDPELARYGLSEREIRCGTGVPLLVASVGRPLLTVSAVPRKQSPGSELAQRRGRPPP
ncbi:hypothetical protein WH47_09102 [Habropoda laboriosa]|uniref:Uncharacterized protein n=1 Tax=Habropoda laboriosa TaxID=597456 RepID=A0A0L7RGC5_9HYME|nr:hypothetical protein WH47_09102 [Habropoda laboriosa]